MKILFVSQYFVPEMGAPAARVFELARAWAARGHAVTVLTGFPNHPTGVIPAEFRDQYFRRDQVEGINVVRVPIYAAPNRGFTRRVLNYGSFALSATLLGRFVTATPDVVIATSPQILTGVAGLALSLFHRRPFVFDVRDLWPRSIVEVGAMKEGSLAVRLLEQLERLLYHQARHIVVVSAPFIPEIEQSGVSREKLSIVENGVDLDLFTPGDRELARKELGIAGPFVASYVGTHGMAHGLDTVLDAARLLQDQPVRFLLVGEGAEKQRLQRRAASEQLSNVEFWDQRPRHQVCQILAASDVCLVLLKDRPLFKTVIPSKIFEFMGAGRAILTTVDGESRTIVERAGAGTYVPPENPTALASTLRRYIGDSQRLDAMGAAGRRFVASNYSRVALADRYLQVLEHRVIPRSVAPIDLPEYRS